MVNERDLADKVNCLRSYDTYPSPDNVYIERVENGWLIQAGGVRKVAIGLAEVCIIVDEHYRGAKKVP